jgi:replicative DNA helicase
LVAAPQLLDRLPWLRAEDFANPACGRVFTAARQLHDEGRRLDFVTVLAAAEADGDGGIGELRAALRSDRSFPTEVPWLARRMVEDAVIRDVATVGRELRRLGAAPHLAGGLGRPMLQTAEQQLGTLRPRADRLLQARAGQARPIPSRALRLTAQPSIPLRRRDDAGRHAG